MTSGQASGQLDLNVGNNTIEVEVVAEDGSTTETYTVVVTREDPTQSPVPLVTVGDESLFLTWGEVSGADNYKVYYNTSNSHSGETCLNDSMGVINDTQATLTDLNNGTTYYIWLKTFSGDSEIRTYNSTAATGTPSGTVFNPMVTDIEPGENALEVSLDKTVVVVFNQALDTDTITSDNVFVTAGGSTVATNLSYVSGNYSIEITPSAGTWAENTRFTVSVTTGIESSGGVPLALNYTFSFTTLDNGELLGRWTFNEGSGSTVADVSGHGFTGTLGSAGGASWPTFENGAGEVKEGGYSLHFQGGTNTTTGSKVSISSSFNYGNEFTITGWVKPETPILGAKTEYIISNRLDEWPDPGFGLYVNNWEGFGPSYATPDGDKVFGASYGNGSEGGVNTTESGFITYGEWRHFAVTVNKNTGKIQFFFDGVPSPVEDLSLTNFQSTGSTLYIGCSGYSSSGSYFFRGYLDDIRVYNLNLTANQILRISNEN